MRRITAAIALVAGLCQSAAAEPWTRLSRPAEGFEVEFSGPITVGPTDLAPGIRPLVLRATTYQQAGDGFIFAVGVHHQKKEQSLDRTVDASFATLRCARQVKPEPLPVRAAGARELRGEKCLGGDLLAVLRHYTRGRAMYQVLAIFPKAREADAQHFLDSFRLIEQRLSARPRGPRG